MSQQWGDRITITEKTGAYDMTPVYQEALRMTLEHISSGSAFTPGDRWTWRDRLSLAWAVLRGDITWSDVG